MATNLICVHHSGCLDRPAVGTCSKCGRGLCAECSTKFKSSKTGKSLCVECFNEELLEAKRDYIWLEDYTRKEQKRMIIGAVLMGIIGLLFFIIFMTTLDELGGLGVLLAFISLIWFPCFGGSYVTIHKTAWDLADFLSGIFRIILFILVLIVLIAISPAMFIYRLITRIKLRKRMIYIAEYCQSAKEANDKFLLMARSQRSSANGTDTIALMNQIAELKKKLETAQSNNNSQDVAQLQKQIDMLKQAQSQSEQERRSGSDELTKLSNQVADYQSKFAEINEEMDVLRGQADRQTKGTKKKK